MDKVLGIEIPGGEEGGDLIERITDWQSWPPQTWGVIAGLLILMLMLWLWRNINEKVKIALTIVLLTIAFLYFTQS